MGRAVVTAPVSSAFPGPAGDSPHTRGITPPQQENDTYRERLFKYIPAEVVTLYLFLNTTVAAVRVARVSCIGSSFLRA